MPQTGTLQLYYSVRLDDAHYLVWAIVTSWEHNGHNSQSKMLKQQLTVHQ